jgi:hypothetical protein
MQTATAELGFYYAGYTNRFWSIGASGLGPFQVALGVCGEYMSVAGIGNAGEQRVHRFAAVSQSHRIVGDERERAVIQFDCLETPTEGAQTVAQVDQYARLRDFRKQDERRMLDGAAQIKNLPFAMRLTPPPTAPVMDVLQSRLDIAAEVPNGGCQLRSVVRSESVCTDI